MKFETMRALVGSFSPTPHMRDRKGNLLVMRRRTHDGVSFGFRMGTGFQGDVNRSHPFWIEQGLQDTTNPVGAYGLAVYFSLTGNTPNAYRGMVAGDTGLTNIAGVAVRPFPIQPSSTSNFGAVAISGPTSAPTAGVPPAGVIDVLKSGYVIVAQSGTGAIVKGAPVFVWVAASSGAHVQGGFEVSSTGGSTIALPVPSVYFNGPAGPDGLVELKF